LEFNNKTDSIFSYLKRMQYHKGLIVIHRVTTLSSPFTLSYYDASFDPKSPAGKPVPLSHRGIIPSHPHRFLAKRASWHDSIKFLINRSSAASLDFAFCRPPLPSPFLRVDPFQDTKRPPLTIDLEDEGNGSEISPRYRVLSLPGSSSCGVRGSFIRFASSCNERMT